MPNAVVQAFAKKANVPVEKAEEFWQDAKYEVYKSGISMRDKMFWQKVNFLTQKKLGLREEMSFREFVDMSFEMPDEAPAPEPVVQAEVPENSPAEEPEQTDLAISVCRFVSQLFGARDVAHMLHLSTRSHAQHVALESLYNDLLDHADKIAEVGAGIVGFPLSMGTADQSPYTAPADAKAFVRELAQMIEVHRGGLFHHVLSNLVDDLLASVYRAKYRIDNLA